MKKPTKVKAVKREPVFTITRKKVPISYEAGDCIREDEADAFHVNLKGGNHEITWTTETRTTKQSIARTIAWLRKYAAGAKVVDLTKAK